MERRRKSSVIAVERIDDGVLRIGDDSVRRMSEVNPDLPEQNIHAKNATMSEKTMSVRDALRLYPKAVAFSLLFSTAVIMEGYDLSLMGSFLGFPPFRNRYGDIPDPDGDGLRISAPWQSGLTNGVQVSRHRILLW